MISQLDFTRFTIADGVRPAHSVLLCGLWGLFAYLGIYPDDIKAAKIARQLEAGGAVYLGQYKITKEAE